MPHPEWTRQRQRDALIEQQQAVIERYTVALRELIGEHEVYHGNIAAGTWDRARAALERLQANMLPIGRELCIEAAAEIERLMAACNALDGEQARLRAALHRLQGCDIDNAAQDIIRAALTHTQVHKL